MKIKPRHAILLIATAGLAFYGAGAFAQRPTAPAPSAATARDLVSKYCLTCHNAKQKSGSLVLENIDADHPANSAETWEKVIVKLRSRAMPPPGMPRPANDTYDAVAGYLETEIDRVALANANPGRTASLHRLNRAEYGNAIRDLLEIEVNPQELLPPDEQAYGFENNADALTIQPALLDRYVAAAASIARKAVGDPNVPPTFIRYGAMKNNANDLTYLRQVDRMGEEFPLGSMGGVAATHYFPVDGDYEFRLHLQRAWDSSIRGLNIEHEFELRIDGERVWQMKLGGGRAPTRTFQYDGDEALHVRVPVKAGARDVMVTMVKTDNSAPEGGGPDRITHYSRASDTPSASIAIASLHIGGPYNGKVPATSPSRDRIFTCQPNAAAEETPCARQILSTLARRAYRRAATDDDVDTLLAFYNRGRANGDFNNGIRLALERLLVSPDFLFRIEADPAGAAPGAIYRVSDVELASRLSFALWSSIPDDELLDVAITGRLHEPAVLEQQVRRMFADKRARASLVENFFSDWLQIRNVWLLNPDGTIFPWFDDNLRTAFVREAELFLDAQLKDDHSAVDLLTSDETFLNEQLARHYDIPGIYGSHFRRVKLADPNRFGLLGKGAILAITSYTTRTSPTVRGKWLLENILAAPMPPPPPNVPPLEASNTGGKPLSVRDMLEVHRKNAVCASCHQRMDPLGLTLENFDAVGQWRTTDAGTPINASGVLLDGTQVDGPGQLRSAFVAKKAQFATAVTEKLLTYMLGRGLEYYDAPAVRAIDRTAAADNYRWSSLMLAIVNSAPFQMRTAAPRTQEGE